MRKRRKKHGWKGEKWKRKKTKASWKTGKMADMKRAVLNAYWRTQTDHVTSLPNRKKRIDDVSLFFSRDWLRKIWLMLTYKLPVLLYVFITLPPLFLSHINLFVMITFFFLCTYAGKPKKVKVISFYIISFNLFHIFEFYLFRKRINVW